METAYSIALGISLSAACGFRVFVPFLVMSLAALTGQLSLSEGFAWVGTVPALAVFASATIAEVAAYYIPWVDNLLDTIATPLALLAGTVASASVLTDVSPVLQWTLAIVAGGGSAGLVQAGTVLLRGASSAATGGLTNFMVASGENTAAAITAVLAIVLPLLALFFVGVLCFFLIRAVLRFRRGQGA